MQKHPLIIHEPELLDAQLICHYSVGSEVFSNSYQFPAQHTKTLSSLTVKLCQWAAITTAFGLFSIDYFDTVICDFGLSPEEIAFFEKVIFLGFGEFRYVNNIPLNQKTTIQGTGIPMSVTADAPGGKGALLLNGGGKDGSVSAYLLRKAGIPFTWFQRGDSAAQANVVSVWDAPVLTVERTLDPNRKNRRYKGHRPMSAGIAFIALLTAHLFGYTEIIASNEASANEGNLVKDGFAVNHQYSKSLEFEQDMQALLSRFDVAIDYFSLVRPLYELQISQIATHLSAEQLGAITSCNNGTKQGIWCMACAKCAFVSLAITAGSPSAAEKVWGSQSAICTAELRPYLIELLDPTIDKPLECVGTLDECQLAAHLIASNYPDVLDSTTLELFKKYATIFTRNMGTSSHGTRGTKVF